MSELKGHWPDLHQPPESFPSAEIKAVISRVSGTETDNVKAAYAASVVVSYGIAQLPHDHLIGELPPMTNDEGLALLQGSVLVRAEGESTALPWATILSFVVPLLLEWLKKRG